MNKALTSLLIAIGIVAVATAVFFGWKYYENHYRNGGSLPAVYTEDTKYNPGAELASKDEGYARGLEYIKSGDTAKGLAELRAAQSRYKPGSIERNVIDYTIPLVGVFESAPISAIGGLKFIASDTSGAYFDVTRALAIEAMGRSFATNYDPAILDEIFVNDPYFGHFLDEAKGNYVQALYALARFGYDLSKTPITSARLAEKAASDIEAKRYTSDSEKAALEAAFDEYSKAGLAEMDKMEGFPEYAGYRAEFSSILGGAMASMHLSGAGTVTRADVEGMYQRAYTSANETLKPFIVLRYGAFISTVDPNNTALIGELSKRLSGISVARRAAFDRFIKNTMAIGKPAGGAYELIVRFRKGSPEFDAYVKQVSGR